MSTPQLRGAFSKIICFAVFSVQDLEIVISFLRFKDIVMTIEAVMACAQLHILRHLGVAFQSKGEHSLPLEMSTLGASMQRLLGGGLKASGGKVVPHWPSACVPA